MDPCRKKSYDTEKEAKAAYPAQQPYKCQRCGKYHNTSNGQSALRVAKGTYAMAQEWIKRKARFRDKRDWRHNKDDD